MGTVALILHLQRVRGTGTAVAVGLVAESLPPLLSPLAGAVADRFGGQRLLVACSILQGLAMAAAAIWLPPLGGLFALVLARATFATVAAPAVGAAVPSLVDDADLPRANALLGGGRELGTVFGPPAAGLLFGVLGVRGVLGIDALTFFMVVPLLALLPTLRLHQDPEAELSSVAADVKEGLRYLWRDPILRGISIGFWLGVFFSASDDLVLAFLAARDLHASPFGVGIALAGASVGLVLGLMALARWGRGIAPLGGVLVGLVIVGIGNLATSAAPVLAVVVATQMLRGGGIALLDAPLRTLVQRRVPRRLLGRTLANIYGGVSVAAALGYVIGGPLLDATSPRFMFVVIGLGGLAGAGLAAFLVRRTDWKGARVTE
jgi:MFS family permease